MNISFDTFNRKRLSDKKRFRWFEFSISSFSDELKIWGWWVELVVFNRMFKFHIYEMSKESKERWKKFVETHSKISELI